ncbi:pectin acetylesterase-family hydrolase [Flagellimonas algicola]|nr:pectin acetylesterase-family hydrolase [Allomuricauda algicola]
MKTSILSMGSLLILSLCCERSEGQNKAASNETNTIVQELQKLSLDKYFNIQPSEKKINEINPDWDNYYYNTDDCRCIFGTEYYTAVKHKSEASKNVIFYMQGGGACWPGVDECKTEISSEDVGYVDGLGYVIDGSLNDWNTVFAPYCDGSVHSGDNAADYDNDGEEDHWFWGFRSTSAAVALTKKLYPDVDKMLITGCSAGGYGTIFATMLLRLQYPDTQFYVLNESGPGLQDPADQTTKKLVQETWKYDAFMPDNCAECKDQMMYLYDWMLRYDSNLKIGLYSSYKDEVIGEDYLRMTPDSYSSLLLSTSGKIQAKNPNRFKRFFINGSSHCVESWKYKVKGVNLTQWVEQLVNDDSSWSDLLE